MRSFHMLLLFILFLPIQFVQAQIQIGTVRGVVTDPGGALVANAKVTLDNSLTGYHSTQTTNNQGEFTFNEVPFGAYVLRAELAGFQAITSQVNVRSNIPVTGNIKLSIAELTETLNIVSAETLVQSDSSGTSTTMDESFIMKTPGAARHRQLQKVIATAPGWRSENDGLLHIRGVDDGVLFVVDGVPITDRLDVVSGHADDTENIRSLTVITGNIPAEFGGRSGAVVAIQSKSTVGEPLSGALSLGAGNFHTRDISATFGGAVKQNLGLLLSFSGNRSRRFLDPVDPGNFNNLGGSLGFNARADWHPTANDVVMFSFAANGADFHITNDEEQEEAGQRQRQELRSQRQSIRWQRLWSSSTVTNLAFYRQANESKLFGSSFDTPLFAAQDRGNSRQGVVGSLTRSEKNHVFKLGFEASQGFAA